MAYKDPAMQRAWNQTPNASAKALARTSARRLKTKNFLDNFKAEQGCIFCGIKIPIVLQFHHRDPSTKLFEVASRKTSSMKKLQDEITKCDVICGNCHAMTHEIERLRGV